MTNTVCRWGILGAANIARKNWQAIHNSGNGQLVAVASRSAARADAYIDDCQRFVPFAARPRACSYDELLASADVDAVYIPLPTGIRKEWVIKAAEAGKHIVCEKPCAANAADLEQMLAACDRHQVQFMDGVMFMHSARLPALRQALDDRQSFGQLRRISSQFSFSGSHEFARQNIRVSGELEPLGCLGDLGWYNLRLSLWAMQYAWPEAALGRILTAGRRPDSQSDVPVEFSGELLFGGGVSASFYCSFITENQQWANLSGSEGAIQISDFVVPFYGHQSSFDVVKPRLIARGCQFNMEGNVRRVSVPEYSNNAPDAQETRLFRTFGDLVLARRIDRSWGEIALQTQRVMDAVLQSAREGGKWVNVTPTGRGK